MNKKISRKELIDKTKSKEVRGYKVKEFVEETLKNPANKAAFDRLINK